MVRNHGDLRGGWRRGGALVDDEVRLAADALDLAAQDLRRFRPGGLEQREL